MIHPFHEEDFEETGGSAVYGHTFLSQRPSTVEWTPDLVNSASFISTGDQYPVILRNMGGDFVCYSVLYAINPHDSNRWFRIQVETWDDNDIAKLCFPHLNPNDQRCLGPFGVLLQGIFTAAIALFTDLNVLPSLVSIGTLFVFYMVANAVVYRRHVAIGEMMKESVESDQDPSFKV
ncbi:hypothetical protein DKX38_002739 [Salix brachista]|uniref:Uncharacterized protein n=1 Tax=Salix brachista TaxID=2182728 RepID=A0A5N5NRN5_9ROSI|nr:hypothetical protein DKX38_002739 [Salix brachista]